ncbi:MAG: molybdopterin-dependent oxidoreductase [Gemmatimonadaceae bacterium]
MRVAAVLRQSFLALGLSSAIAAAQPTPGTLTLIGLDGTTKSLGVGELQGLPQVEVSDSGASGKVRFRGPTVRSLVSLVGAPEGRALRGPSMLIVVVAEASDGYKVAYTLSELDEQFGGRTAIVAVTADGQPLNAESGPLRLAMGGEGQHRARWIRQLKTLRLVRVGDAAR